MRGEAHIQVGFALTQHCNLRCAHCIRDDVTTVQSLSYDLISSILEQASLLYDSVGVSLTGGEPLLHPDFGRLVDRFAAGNHPYRFVSNGWHLARALPHIERNAPTAVRLSLSGATREVHDAERGRGSFHRVLMGVGLLTSRGIPTHLSIVVDRRTRAQLREAADLSEAVGAHELHYILPQPVTESAARDTDLALDEWDAVATELDALARECRDHVRIMRDYGFPDDDLAGACGTMQRNRLYVDAWGRLATCCQLSDYGFNTTEVVADLHTIPLADAVGRFDTAVTQLTRASTRYSNTASERFPCLRCARATGKLEWGKLEWLAEHPRHPWSI
jgi:MoaA/NifB/PqqE/SkfB family radical SAM enzyme